MPAPIDTDIREMLIAFIEGKNRDLASAGALEVALERAFPDDVDAQDLVLALAAYRPGGGYLLYDETMIVPLCRKFLNKLPGR
jgi:hypothetical protein